MITACQEPKACSQHLHIINSLLWKQSSRILFKMAINTISITVVA